MKKLLPLMALPLVVIATAAPAYAGAVGGAYCLKNTADKHHHMEGACFASYQQCQSGAGKHGGFCQWNPNA